MAEPEQILELSQAVNDAAADKIVAIKKVTGATRILSLNALIEASRAGDAGRGFAVVAGEVKAVSDQISAITEALEAELGKTLGELMDLGSSLVKDMRGQRLADLALNMIDLIDRNLYERSCDVRWWATDSAMVECLALDTPAASDHACRRLGVILDSYTVYLDLWIANADGQVVANGRPETYPRAIGTNVANARWFRDAMETEDGGCYAVADIAPNDSLGGRLTATYATAIREGGEAHGRVLGALGIFFDWQPQAQGVVENVRLTPQERDITRCLLVDHNHRVIAASDNQGILTETLPLCVHGQSMGNFTDDQGRIVGFALTPGYETYDGLGWYGVIVQDPPKIKAG